MTHNLDLSGSRIPGVGKHSQPRHMTSGKVLNFHESWFPHMKSGNNMQYAS